MTSEEAIKNIVAYMYYAEDIPVEVGKAFDVAIKALRERPQGEWIPVDERLPEEFQECLVIDAEGEYGIGYYREDAKAWDSPNWGWLERADKVDNREAFVQPCGIHKVIAWMPLPAPYKLDT